MEEICLHNDDKFYSSQDNWIHNLSYITTYGLKISQDELALIMLGDEDESSVMFEILMDRINKTNDITKKEN